MAAELKPYPGYKDSGVEWLGAVPAHWEVRRLRTVAEMRVSNVDKHTKEGEATVRLCNYIDVYKNDRIRCGMAFMPGTATADEILKFRLRCGDVLITKDSEMWNDIGVPALVQAIVDVVVSGYHLALLRPHTRFLGGAFLFRALQSSCVARQLHIRANGVMRFGLSQDAIKSVRLPVAPLREQAAIVRFLDHADRRIRRYIRTKQRLIALLEEQKQAIIHESVTGRIDVRTERPYPAYKDSGVEWLGRVPGHWERMRLKTVLRPVDRRSVDGNGTLLSLRRDHGVVVYADHFSHPPQSSSLVGFKLVKAGQLVVNRLQANNGLVFCSSLDGAVSPDYSVVEKKCPIHMRFLSDVLRTSMVRAHFRGRSKGLGTGSAGFLRLYDDQFLATPVALPPLTEQAAIVESVDRNLSNTQTAVACARRDVELLGEYRKRLIADVVTAKLDVREAATELRNLDPLAAEEDPDDDFSGPSGSEVEGYTEEEGPVPDVVDAGWSEAGAVGSGANVSESPRPNSRYSRTR